MRPLSLAFVLHVLITGCMSHELIRSNASFADTVSGSGTITVVGWSKLYGELDIYPDRESFDHSLMFPNCISGVFSHQEGMNLSAYDEEWVTVTGELFRFSDLPDEQRPAIPRKMLSGSVITNWCYGDNVLLIKSIRLVSRPAAAQRRDK